MEKKKEIESVIEPAKVESEEIKTLPGTTSVNKKMFLYGFGGLVALALVVVIVLSIVKVYKYAATDAFTVGVARALRLPAMKVNGERVLFSEFADDLEAINKMKAFDVQSGGPNASLTDEVMSDQVLWRLANNILVSKMASEYGVAVVDNDINTIREQILKQFKTSAEADKELNDRYGWSLEMYTNKVIRPYILHGKLVEKIGTDQKAREEVRSQAQKVLDDIKAGADFAEMAKKYGSDGTAASGGDLGWFRKGDMVPEFENAAFVLKKGELSSALVETQYGYHIIKTDDKKTEKVKNDLGKMVNEELVKASHILFAFPNADKYLDDAAKKAEIHLYVALHNPFEALQTPAVAK